MSLLAEGAVKNGHPAVTTDKSSEVTSQQRHSRSEHDQAALKRPRKIPRQSWDYVIRSGTAGGLAACAAKTLVAPLDRVKILFQASNPQFAKYTGSWTGALAAMRDIYNQNGAKGLFRGHSATLLRIFPYGGIKFLAYEQFRAVIIPTKDLETHYRRFIAGACSGCASVFLTYPLEVIRVRLAFETKSMKRVTLPEICRTIYNKRPPTSAPQTATLQSVGIPPATAANITQTVAAVAPRSGLVNFFRGFTPTIWGMIPYAGSSFLTHDAAGDLMRHPGLAPYSLLPMTEAELARLPPGKPRPLRAWAELTTGAVAGLISQTLSYPLEVIRRRMQVGGVVGDGHRLTMAEVAGNIFKDKGWRGFYVYERMKVVFGI